MSWNYRVVQSLDSGIFNVCEVYYKDGSPYMWSGACTPFGESLDELRRELERFNRALELEPLRETLSAGGELKLQLLSDAPPGGPL